jgi:hypothetical protein
VPNTGAQTAFAIAIAVVSSGTYPRFGFKEFVDELFRLALFSRSDIGIEL